MEYSFSVVFYRVQRLSRFTNKNKAGIAQLVERPTERSGAMLMQVRVPRATREFLPSQLPVQTLLHPCVR